MGGVGGVGGAGGTGSNALHHSSSGGRGGSNSGGGALTRTGKHVKTGSGGRRGSSASGPSCAPLDIVVSLVRAPEDRRPRYFHVRLVAAHTRPQDGAGGEGGVATSSSRCAEGIAAAKADVDRLPVVPLAAAATAIGQPGAVAGAGQGPGPGQGESYNFPHHLHPQDQVHVQAGTAASSGAAASHEAAAAGANCGKKGEKAHVAAVTAGKPKQQRDTQPPHSLPSHRRPVPVTASTRAFPPNTAPGSSQSQPLQPQSQSQSQSQAAAASNANAVLAARMGTFTGPNKASGSGECDLFYGISDCSGSNRTGLSSGWMQGEMDMLRNVTTMDLLRMMSDDDFPDSNGAGSGGGRGGVGENDSDKDSNKDGSCNYENFFDEFLADTSTP